ncbi:integrase catalytic domain-containing protein [Trichonephila clavipes]|nr:integrase catalytic domain-containing protein [Trichonephila clavipes]
MKNFYQKLWLTETDWDSPIPQQLTEDWLKFQKAFNEINYLTVPRWVIFTADNIVELHGFADASSLAYAAAIYCRQKHNGKIKVQLLVSKTKVASVKHVSIPRLELCGAHFLSKLFKSVLRTLKHYTFDVFARMDSKIVLSWLSSHPRKWKTFLANRTSEIMEVLPTKHWRHVPSKENPADIASRASSQGSSISSSHINTTSLTFSETKTAEETIFRWVQDIYFQEEIQSIKKQIFLPPKSPLRSLHPFIDEHGLVRVGGRLQNSQLRFNSKHPIILPSQQTTKAVHIEAVGDLTTDSFIAALHRFSARRGAPRHIYSDNGTNFVGARRKLDEIRKLWLSLPTNEAISYYLSKSSIDWHFIPLSSPHFGGDVLSVPEELPSTSNRRDRWELLQNIKRDFWKKWSYDYISSLQPRKKWQDAQPSLKEDDIVLIKEEGSPGTWPMARVLQVYPGNDGLVRVATVKSQDSVLKRPVHKLHKLPIYPN